VKRVGERLLSYPDRLVYAILLVIFLVVLFGGRQ